MIVVNLSKTRSDALVVVSEGLPHVVPLPEATPEVVFELAEKTNSRTTEKEMKIILNTLWRIIVNPIVSVLKENLGLKRGSRIWWCPTAAASLLPLHAAGNYNTRGQTLSDLFISSYTPTLASLLRARDNNPVYTTATPNILVVGQSHDPTLPTVGPEIEAIRRIAGVGMLLDGKDATGSSVLEAIKQYPWVHLACHGNVDEARPFRSHFSLYSGPLTLLDLASQDLPNAQLAFLSSCHSAEGNRSRPDEVLHLTAGVQFAGFRSVVGTLWAVDGQDGPHVAQTFYSNLLGSGEKATKSSAVALHRATTELRKSRIPSVRWACFVHYGC